MSGVLGPSSDMYQKHPLILSNFCILCPCDSSHDHISGLGVSTSDSDTTHREAGHVVAENPGEGPGHRVLSTAAQAGD